MLASNTNTIIGKATTVSGLSYSNLNASVTNISVIYTANPNSFTVNIATDNNGNVFTINVASNITDTNATVKQMLADKAIAARLYY